VDGRGVPLEIGFIDVAERGDLDIRLLREPVEQLVAAVADADEAHAHCVARGRRRLHAKARSRRGQHARPDETPPADHRPPPSPHALPQRRAHYRLPAGSACMPERPLDGIT